MARQPKAAPAKRGRKPNLRIKVIAPQEQLMKQISDLQAQVAAATELADRHNEERKAALDERARARNAERDAYKVRDEVLAENDLLRRQLRDRELDAERMRGYLDGLEDAKPAPMIEAPRDRKFGTYIRREEPQSFGNAGYGSPPPPQWWERPR